MVEPAHRLPTDTDDGMVLIISGPSGAGKTTITRGVERGIPGSVFSVSATTRQRTDADVEGVDYRFVTDDEFETMKSRGEFLETAGVYGKKYGTPKAWVLEQIKRGRLVILEIDVQGAISVKHQIHDAFAVYILPPSENSLLERLRSRKRESEEIIQRRYEQGRAEIEQARTSGIYNAFIVNDVLEDSIKQAIKLVNDERARRQRA
ncbi:MAG: guanylate kinase [Phycisphaeraceae bacterium]|nr:MAG: guanylate kinase [Phycisphaeraceae bacterium]